MGSERARQASNMLASGHELLDKGLSNREIATFKSDVTEDPGQIVFGRFEINEPTHSVAATAQFLRHCGEVPPHVMSIMFPTLGNRGIQCFA